MDYLNHSDNILLNRKDLFDILQTAIFGNLKNALMGIYDIQPRKIIVGNSEYGLLSDNAYAVTRTSTGNISVAPGVAINDETSFMVLTEDAPVSATAASGVYGIYLTYKQNRALTGKEQVLPVKAGINAITMHTMLTDGCELQKAVPTSPPAASILLAYVVIDTNAVPVSSTSTLNGDIYLNETEVALPSSISLPAWFTAISAAYKIVRVGEEYIKIDNSKIITERGVHNTIKSHHVAGETVTIAGIIDARQMSLLNVRGMDKVETAISRGTVYIQSAERMLVTRAVVRHTAAPIVTLPTTPILWVNRSRSMGMVTDRVRQIYHGINALKTSIDNDNMNIQDIRYQMLGADQTGDQYVALAAEMRRIQNASMSNQVTLQEMIQSMSNEDIAGYMRSSMNEFKLVVNINYAPPSGMSISQYEARVIRTTITNVMDVYSMENAEYHYTQRKHATGYDAYGDPILEGISLSDTSIKIPINVGEKITVTVRPIDTAGTVGMYSDPITYEFARFDDADYMSYQDIYRIFVPDILETSMMFREYTMYSRELYDQLSTYSNQLQQSEIAINDLTARLTELENRFRLLYNVVQRHIDTLNISATGIVNNIPTGNR